MKNEARLAILDEVSLPQTGIPPASLYHRRLAAELRLRHGIHLKVLLDAQDANSGYGERIHRLVKREPCDTVLLHVRSLPYLNRCQVLWRDGALSAKARQSIFSSRLHPAIPVPHLFPVGDVVAPPEPDIDVERRDSLWHSLNLLLGEALGLDHWARWEEARQLDAARTECRRAGLRLIVMGPMPLGPGRMENRLVGKLAHYLARTAPNLGLEFLDCFWDQPWGDASGISENPDADATASERPNPVNPLLAEDGRHLSALGHARLARRLAEAWGG